MASELVQLSLNIGATDGDSTPPEVEAELPLIEVGVLEMDKLELTWYGKDESIHIEPRLLIENKAMSNTAADPDTENMLIHGDNLLALKALENKFSAQIKCIYIDIMTTKTIQFNFASGR